MNRLEQHAHSTPKKAPTHLLGVGLDNKDGHKRITQAERFAIVGGSQETHERMTETVVKTFETLDRRGKSLDKIEPSELKDVIKESTPE
jgi:hypothetical protein